MFELALAGFILILIITLFLQHEEVGNQQKIISELRKFKQSEHEVPHQDSIYQQKFQEMEKELTTKAYEDYQELLDQNIQNLQQEYHKSLTEAQMNFKDFLKKLEQETLNSQKDMSDQTGVKVNNILISFEQNLADFLSKAETQSLESINLELKAARQLIDSYKTQQFSIIDENIVAVLERAMSLVLKQKLSLKDEMDLVYEALEKAKLEKFFV